MFAAFQDWLEDTDAESGFVNSGYLIVASEGDFAEKLRGNLAMQSDIGAETFLVSREEALERHPLLALDDAAVIGYEPNSGYADPYLTTTSFIRAARAKGAVVETDRAVEGLIVESGRVKGVRTAQGEIHAPLVISAIGPWTRSVTEPIGLEIPLEVSRHIVLAFGTATPYGAGLPVIKDLTTANKMYFRPASGGVVLVGTGDHGDPIADPEDMDENVAEDFVLLQGRQLARRMPSFAAAAPTANWVGPYDITPDWNPVLGPAPGVEGLTLAFGFSGHGFKLAPAVGLTMAQQVLGQDMDVDITPYGLERFAEGKLLVGAYGVGSIS
jgi:sarcosine oxidase subunit beta